ncbi:MFS transporter, partial [Francisella tularensis subsp. holarctica]|nr:MFS transporter [Francisella tularensis subsp. holarctica]
IKPVHQGIFTGYIFLNVAIGIVISGPVSNYAICKKLKAEDITALGTNQMYSNNFVCLTVIAIILTIIFFLISKKIN